MKLTGLRFNGTSASSDITKVGLRAILPIQRQWVSAVCYTRASRGASWGNGTGQHCLSCLSRRGWKVQCKGCTVAQCINGNGRNGQVFLPFPRVGHAASPMQFGHSSREMWKSHDKPALLGKEWLGCGICWYCIVGFFVSFPQSLNWASERWLNYLWNLEWKHSRASCIFPHAIWKWLFQKDSPFCGADFHMCMSWWYVIRLMEEILHDLGCINSCKYWEKLPTSTGLPDFFQQYVSLAPGTFLLQSSHMWPKKWPQVVREGHDPESPKAQGIILQISRTMKAMNFQTSEVGEFPAVLIWTEKDDGAKQCLDTLGRPFVRLQ